MDHSGINDGIRVLLVDDHPAIRAGIRAILSKAPDIEVVAEAEDGIAARHLAAGDRPDVLLLDLRMPGEPPLETMTGVKAASPETAVLILTAHNRDAYLAAVLAAGAAGFVIKDEAPEQLVTAVRRAAQGEILFSGEQRARASRWQQAVGQPWQSLTAREREVLALLAGGKTDREIGQALGIGNKTVGNHVGHILEKLGVASRTAAALWFDREIVRQSFLILPEILLAGTTNHQ
jgi:DNA-binding NarL/FixJ family response regulator